MKIIKNYEKKIGRNKECPCKSGKKYKYCHGRIEEAIRREQFLKDNK